MIELQKDFIIDGTEIGEIYYKDKWNLDVFVREISFSTKSMVLEVRLVNKSNPSYTIKVLEWELSKEGKDTGNGVDPETIYRNLWENHIDFSSGEPVLTDMAITWILRKVKNLQLDGKSTPNNR